MAVELVYMVELVIVEVDTRFEVSLLYINVAEVLFPGHFWSLFGVEVDPDKPVAIDVGVDGKETVLVFVEVEILVARGFG